jgi:hypothetical protein
MPTSREVAARLEAAHGLSAHQPPELRRLIVERALAEEKIEQRLRHGEAPIALPKVKRYYLRNIFRFERRERRYFDIIENLPSPSIGRELISEIETGHGATNAPIREVLDRPRLGEYIPVAKRPIYRAIFETRPNAYVGPVPLNNAFAIFKVTRIRPRKVEPFARVRATTERWLAAAEHRHTLEQFLKAWRARWLAQTSCAAAYVMVDCREHRGSPASQEVPEGLR